MSSKQDVIKALVMDRLSDKMPYSAVIWEKGSNRARVKTWHGGMTSAFGTLTYLRGAAEQQGSIVELIELSIERNAKIVSEWANAELSSGKDITQVKSSLLKLRDVAKEAGQQLTDLKNDLDIARADERYYRRKRMWEREVEARNKKYKLESEYKEMKKKFSVVGEE